MPTKIFLTLHSLYCKQNPMHLEQQHHGPGYPCSLDSCWTQQALDFKQNTETHPKSPRQRPAQLTAPATLLLRLPCTCATAPLENTCAFRTAAHPDLQTPNKHQLNLFRKANARAVSSFCSKAHSNTAEAAASDPRQICSPPLAVSPTCLSPQLLQTDLGTHGSNHTVDRGKG